MTEYAIPQNASFDGEWWLPEAPAEKISGTLVWTPDKARLALHNTFAPLRGEIFAGDAKQYPVVHGLSTASEFVTVLKAWQSSRPFNIGPAGLRESEKLISTLVVVGAHVSSESKFSEITARIPGLAMWLDPSAGIKTTLMLGEGDSPAKAIYEIQCAPENRFEIPTIPATLAWSLERSLPGSPGVELSVKTTACIKIRPSQPQELDWFIDYLGRATALLGILAGSSMAPDRLVLSMPDGSHDVHVLIALRESAYCSIDSAYEFFMSCQNMGIGSSVVFATWYKLYDRINMPAKLALSVLYSKGLWLHVEFLSLMQALEGFHRAVMPGLYISDSDYEATRSILCAAIPENISADHRTSLTTRLKYGNQYSLRKRLGELADRLSQPIRVAILGPDGTIPGDWVHTRNYYTHWDESLLASVLDGPGMHRAGVRMKHLLRALYLQLVGIPDGAILKSLGNGCDESQYLIQLNNADHRRRNPGSTAGSIIRITTEAASAPPPKGT